MPRANYIPVPIEVLDHDDADDVYGHEHEELRMHIDLPTCDDSDCDHAYLAQCGCVRCVYCGRRAA